MKTHLSSLIFHLFSRKGQTALSLVMLVGTLSVLIGVSVSFLASSFLNVGYGFEAGERALAVARAGVDDAMLQLVRNKNFSETNQSVPVGSSNATVTVTNTVDANGQAVITSSATVLARTKKVQSTVSIDSITGLVTPVSTTLIQ